MSTLFIAEATTWTPEEIATVIREQIAEDYSFADNLRTAVMYCPRTLTSNEFVAAAVSVGVNAGTARNRFSEVRRQQIEDGE